MPAAVQAREGVVVVATNQLEKGGSAAVGVRPGAVLHRKKVGK
jgi:hypothetical protein